MSSNPETTFITSVNKLLPLKRLKMCAVARALVDADQHIHYEKMNNPYSAGTADGWYSGEAGDLWVEYKYLPRIPQRGIIDPMKLLSPLQANWLSGRYDEGRNVAVIIGCPSGGVLLRDRLWESSMTAKEYGNLLRTRQGLAAWIKEQTTR